MKLLRVLGSLPLFALGLAGLVLPRPTGSAEPPRTPSAPKFAPEPAIRILSETVLPAALAKAADVRWASDRSIYLALRDQGVVEIPLETPSAPPREVVAGRAQLGGFFYSTMVGASARHLVAAAPALSITSVSLDTQGRWDEAFEVIHALDVQGDRLLILGMRRDEQGEVGKDGAIAWIGSLDKKLADLVPVVYDATGPGVRDMGRCCALRLGGARFLDDGTFVVIPGVQPGIQLRDREGKLIRNWDTGTLGIDTDCALLSIEDGRRIQASGEEQLAWINQRRTIDTVLPLPEGIGLVLRSVEKGKPRWDLKVLRSDGSVLSRSIPIEGGNEMFHLRGDVRAGKIVLGLFEERVKDENYAVPRLFLASLPDEHTTQP